MKIKEILFDLLQCEGEHVEVSQLIQKFSRLTQFINSIVVACVQARNTVTFVFVVVSDLLLFCCELSLLYFLPFSFNINSYPPVAGARNSCNSVEENKNIQDSPIEGVSQAFHCFFSLVETAITHGLQQFTQAVVVHIICILI